MPTRARIICSAPRCPNLKPCAVHQRRPWGGTSQAQRTGQPRLPESIRQRILTRDRFICQECGAQPANEIDHVISRGEGGTHENANLLTLCSRCHGRKSGEEGARARRRAG